MMPIIDAITSFGEKFLNNEKSEGKMLDELRNKQKQVEKGQGQERIHGDSDDGKFVQVQSIGKDTISVENISKVARGESGPTIIYKINPQGGRDFEIRKVSYVENNGIYKSYITGETGHMTNNEFVKTVLPKLERRIEKSKSELNRSNTKKQNAAIMFSEEKTKKSDQYDLKMLENQLENLSA